MKYLDLAIANEQIKTTDIKGKDYAEVNQRIKAFRMVYPQGTIETEMLSNENGVVVFKANVYDEKGYLIATGTAYEKEDSSFINKTSYIENCETSAVGRALGMAGFGIDVSVASAEEVQNAINNQAVTEEDAKSYTLTFGKFKGKTIKEIFDEKPDYIEWLMANTKDERILKIIEIETGLVMPSEEEQTKHLELLSQVKSMAIKTSTEIDKICETYGVDDLKNLTIDQLEQAIRVMSKKED